MKANFLSFVALLSILCAIIISVCALAPNFKNVEIGPNSPYIWDKGESIKGEGEFFIESENTPITIFFVNEKREKQYLTQTIEGETPLGQNQTFYGQFQAIDNTEYKTDGDVSIYSLSSTNIVVKYRPIYLLSWVALFLLISCTCFYYLVKDITK